MNRTITVATRLSEQTLRTTYINEERDDPPFIVTIDLSEPPHNPIGGGVPPVGETIVTVTEHG